MPIVPSRVQDLLDFADNHYAGWITNAANIGLSAGQAGAFKTAANTARSDFNAAVLADQVKKSATGHSQDSVRALRHSAADVLALIKAYAENQANPMTVYTLAQIPPPAAPGPVGRPGTPTDFTVTLMQNGSVGLKWKCINPVNATGTIYEARRRIGSSSEFTFIGASGIKSFTDETLPSGSTNVVYQITAVRSTSRGNPAQFNVNFGVGGDGFVFATVAGDEPVKMAA